MEFVYDDGGRSKYFDAKNVGDCVCRAITIATGKDYLEVYNEIEKRGSQETSRQLKKHRGNKRSSARNGVYKETWKKYLIDLGWTKHSTCLPGKGVMCHLTAEELPNGTLIVQLPHHLVCVKDGVLHDTYDSSVKRYWDCDLAEWVVNDRRAVYSYWVAE